MNNTDRINIYLLAENTLDQERLEIVDLIHAINNSTIRDFNKCFVVKPEKGASFEELINNCELAIIVVCSDLDNQSLIRERIMEIHDRHRNCHLYLFFKDPVEPREKENIVNEFKSNLETSYGHFPVIRNGDQIKFELLMRLIEIRNHFEKEVSGINPLQIDATQNIIKYGKEKIADIDQIPYFSNNVELCNSIKSIQELKSQDPSNYERIISLENAASRVFNKTIEIFALIQKNISHHVYEEATNLLSSGKIDECITLIESYVSNNLRTTNLLQEGNQALIDTSIELLKIKASAICSNSNSFDEKRDAIRNNYDEIIKIAESHHFDHDRKINLYEEYAGKMSTYGAYSPSIDLLNKACRESEHLMVDNKRTGKKEYARITIKLGLCHFKMGNYNSALAYFKEAIQIYDDIIDENQTELALLRNKIVAIVYVGRSIEYETTYHTKGSNIKRDGYKESKKYYDSALELATKINDISLIWRIKTDIGEYLRNRETYEGHLEDALKCHKEALLYAQKGNVREIISSYYLNIGATYADISWDYYYYKKALDHYYLALQNCTQSKDGTTTVNYLYMYSKIQHDIGNLNAQHYYYLCRKNKEEESQSFFVDAQNSFEEAYQTRLSLYNGIPTKEHLDTLYNTTRLYASLLLHYTKKTKDSRLIERGKTITGTLFTILDSNERFADQDKINNLKLIIEGISILESIIKHENNQRK